MSTKNSLSFCSVGVLLDDLNSGLFILADAYELDLTELQSKATNGKADNECQTSLVTQDDTQVDKECQTSITQDDLETKQCLMNDLKTKLSMSSLQEINASNIKKDKAKLKFFTGFIHPDLFDICFDFVVN
jgi:hypothetical protein